MHSFRNSLCFSQIRLNSFNLAESTRTEGDKLYFNLFGFNFDFRNSTIAISIGAGQPAQLAYRALGLLLLAFGLAAIIILENIFNLTNWALAVLIFGAALYYGSQQIQH